MFFLTQAFWIAASERAVKSFGQGALVGIGGNMANAWELDYFGVAGVALGMALVSVLTSLASAGVGEKGSPSIVTTPPAAEPNIDDPRRVTSEVEIPADGVERVVEFDGFGARISNPGDH